MKSFFFAFNIVFSIISVLIFILSGLDPRTYWMFSIFSLFFPILFIGNILLILIWLVFHRNYMLLPIITLLVGWNHWGKLISLEGETKDKKCNGESFTVMTFNIYGLKRIKSNEEIKFQAKKNKFLSFIRNNDPDVLCVQENNLFSDDLISKSEVFPYSHYMVQHGTGIYSKHPIMDMGNVEFGTKTNSCLWADILIRGKKTRIYSLHLQSNKVSKDLNKITDDDEENSSERLSILRRIFGSYKEMAIVRAQQAELVRDHAIKSTMPVIICGDFNDTPFSYPYEVLSIRYKDSFLESGEGLGSTFTGALPGLRIDNILADKKKYDFCFHRVLQTPFSDHNPVLVKIVGRY